MRNELAEITKAAVSSLEKPGVSDSPLPKHESPQKSVIYVFRHSQTFDNKRRIFSGRRNSHLTPEGKKQASKLARKLKNKKIDLGITPDLIRCKDTLKAVLKYHPRAKIEFSPLLKERDYGKLTGQSKLVWMRKNPILMAKYRRAYDFPPPGGESLKDVQKRVFPFCQNLVSDLKKRKKRIAISCTNNTMRFIRMYFEDLSILRMQTLENPFDDYASYVIG